jgi:uncharacterized membrane protein YdjX (TVP38/TMEM64 family)
MTADAQSGGTNGSAAAVPGRVAVLGLALGLAAVGFAFAWWRGWVSPASIQAAARAAGPWAMAVYVPAVVVLELVWMPRMWGLIAGGLLFGPVAGGLLSLGADMASAAVAYALARGAAREFVAARLARRPKAERIVRLLAQRRGGTTIAVLRVCPIAHYTLVSLAAGMGGVPWGAFAAGTAVGIVPGAILYPVLGDAMTHPGGPVFLASAAILVAALAATLVWGRRVLRDG